MAVIEVGVKYTLTGPDGTRAVFNDPSDPNYVGMLTEVTGLDSPEVRESADDLVEFDGGIHGDFFYGRRPITMSGTILNPASGAERNYRQRLLSRASDAMRGDATLTWTPSGMEEQMTLVRRQQPLRITGAWQKQFQLAMVAQDPRIYSSNINTLTVTSSPSTSTSGRIYPKRYPIAYSASAPLGQLIVTNTGTSTSYPFLRIFGPGNNPIISNFTTGESVRLIYGLGSGDWLTVDMLNHTVLLNDSTSRYSAVDFINSNWWGLVPGDNDIRIAFDTFITGSSLQVNWRNASI